jgi:hypothetical protein
MKTLVGIQGHRSAQQAIDCNRTTWQKSGCDIVALEGIDSEVSCWPDYIIGILMCSVRGGRWCGYGMKPTLLIDCIKELARVAEERGYEAILWTECDSIFLGKVPEVDDGVLGAFIAGYCPEQWRCGSGPFLHPPFLMTVTSAKRWLENAESVVEFSNGTNDVVAAMAAERAGLEVKSLPGVWSTNGLDMRLAPKLQEAATAAQSGGCWHIHGIKHQEHLDFILGRASNWPKDIIWS